MSLPSPSSSPPTEATALPSQPTEKWFNQEVHPHGSQLKAYLRGQFPTVRDVDDVVQESYLRTWKAKTIQPIRSAKAFLFSVARHLALNVMRSNRRSPLLFEGDHLVCGVLDDGPGIHEILTNKEKRSVLADALTRLPKNTREVILLHKIDGLTQRETAERLGLTPKTVEHHVARGITFVTKFISDQGHDVF